MSSQSSNPILLIVTIINKFRKIKIIEIILYEFGTNCDNSVTIYVKLFYPAHLNKGDGLAWASQSNVTAWPSFFIISSNLDLGGNRGGLLPTGSKNEKGERFTYRGINRYLHICETNISLQSNISTWSARCTFNFRESKYHCFPTFKLNKL